MLNAVLSLAFQPTRHAAVAAATLCLAATQIAAAQTAPDKPPGRTIVLVGDRPMAGDSAARASMAVDLTTAVATMLSGTVIDRTQPGATLEDVQGQATEIAALRPSAVLVFAGPPEKLSDSPDDQQSYHVQSFARAVTAEGASVFILPASTAVGPAEAAVLRINASGAGPQTHFVELGSELAGKPFEEALESVEKTLASSPQPAAVPSPPAATPVAETRPEPESVLPPALAGEPAEEKNPDGPQPEKTPAIDRSGTVRLSGSEATSATIQMRPPAPLKQFSPRRPAPNKPGEKKQPSFAR